MQKRLKVNRVVSVVWSDACRGKWFGGCMSYLAVLVAIAVHLMAVSLHGEEQKPSFEADIQPIFEARCIACHQGASAQSGLVMETVEALLAGGEKEGPSIIPGNSAESSLLLYLRGERQPQMPIGGDPLPAEQIDLIALWVDQLSPGGDNSSQEATETAGAAASAHQFETTIKPLLEQHCFTCHSIQNHQSGLVLETLASLLKGGSLGGPGVIPGDSGSSPLVQRLRGEKAPQMPLNGEPLSHEQVEAIARWIDELEVVPVQESAEAAKPAWPWTPLEKPAVPEVSQKGWVKNPIDAFVLAKLEEKGMQPAPSVAKRQLLRRLYFDLIGLPPTPEEMEAFLQDDSSDAYHNAVETLLADSRYGERWARHWMDVVRYGDSVGGGLDYPLAHMWRYRDYIIRAFNQDKPYDRFIKEQIAGDAYRFYGAEGQIATAFMNLQVQVEGSGDQRRDFLTDVVNTTGSVFLGVTLGCARCHDHKYDPITHQDYYRIEAFFAPMPKPLPQPVAFTQYELPRQNPELWERKAKEWEDRLKKRKEWADGLRKQVKEITDPHRILMSPLDLKDWVVADLRRVPFSTSELVPKEISKQFSLIGRQNARFANPNDPSRYKPMAYVPSEPLGSVGYAPTTFLLKGGDPDLKQEVVEPGFVVAASGDPEPVDLKGWSGSRRKKLASWLASPENPLTPRVMVNRIWQHHFGKGLVKTPSDLGKNGGGTVHPELIDWLAAEFIEKSWSIKDMHRLMLHSNLYRQSLNNPRATEFEAIDSANRYLWRMPPIRLEAEVIRDSILAVSGDLNLLAGGPSFFPDLEDDMMKRARTWWEPDPEEERNRRSVYMLQQRVLVSPLISVFDGPNISESCDVREVTTVTPQVFALFNSKFAHQKSHAMAERIVREVGTDPGRQVERAFQLALQRQPTEVEKIRGMKFLGVQTDVPGTELSLTQAAYSPESAESLPSRGKTGRSLSDFCLAMFNLNEFIFLQ